ncbi:unnamed protein product [Somion occarium]|uniref:Peptidase A1 domain-containing protein n=1 Tax=Somion occarium TaxID=3059160 RepID=A0ABP1D7Z6_9APHY
MFLNFLKVQIDTGSSDLWLDTKGTRLQGLTDTGVVGSILYVDGTGAVGNIDLGNVTWGEFTVEQQAFINAPGSNATAGGQIQGLLGVGPPLLSNVDAALSASKSKADGSSFLDNVFAFYPDEPNFMTFYLSRSEVGTIDGGEFTIGDVVQNFSDITQTPKLNVVSPDNWFTFMDAVNINGDQLYGGSLGSPEVKVPDNQTLILLDSGTSLSTAPPDYVDAMYKNLPNASFDDESGFYIVPCDSKVNVSMVFGENEFPMHPIDLILPAAIDDDGSVVCVGVFTYAPDNAGVDFILGDAFLRNVYSLFDFGNWAKVGDGFPFMQILSVTDIEKAWAEFDTLNKARLDAFVASHSSSSSSSTTSDATAASTQARPPISTSKSGSGIKDASGALADSDSSSSSVDLSNVLRLSYIIIGMLGLIVVLLIGAVVTMVVRNRRSGGKGYKTLHDPVPPSHEKPYQSSYSDYTTPYADGGH